MQSQTVTAITISIAAQEVRRPLLRTFVPLSMIRILQFCSLFVYFCSRFLAEIAREKEEVEEERYRRRSQDSGSKERARAGWFDAPMGVVSNFDMFR